MSKIVITGWLLVLWCHLGLAKEPDWHDYQQLLTHFVSQQKIANTNISWVNYSKLKQSPLLTKLSLRLQRFDPKQLTGNAEKLAFYINAYNILAIKMVVDHWPIDSIKQAGHFFRPVWYKEAGKIGGQSVSLDYIEHKVLRPLGDPRIHMAIVCASKGCPSLLTQPYTAKRLNQQLDQQANRYLSDSKHGLFIDGKHIHISKIFAWFVDDFKAVGGVRKWLKRYRSDLPNLPIKTDIDYDWSLNGS